MSAEDRYARKEFSAEFTHSFDTYRLEKLTSRMVRISVKDQLDDGESITIRSREDAISLHHFLGRLLADEGDESCTKK